jgi:hypothetical protein
MGKKKSKDKRRCIYCNRLCDHTRDHVPPKGIFAFPLPTCLITVPACSACNISFAKDDDYFKLIMTSRHDVGHNPAAKKVMESAIRGLWRPQATGFRRSFLRTIKPVELTTGSGIYLGKSCTTDVDYDRLERVVERTVRGLYFRWKNRPLPKAATIAVYLDMGFEGATEEARATLLEMMAKLQRERPLIIRAGEFQCWRAAAIDREYASAWLMLFYGAIWYLAITLPPGLEFDGLPLQFVTSPHG